MKAFQVVRCREILLALASPCVVPIILRMVREGYILYFTIIPHIEHSSNEGEDILFYSIIHVVTVE